MNLIIGSTSQMASYFPEHYEKISSRDIQQEVYESGYNSVFITFAEQRTFDKNISEKDFIDVNVKYTDYVVDKLSPISERIVLYGTAELWNAHDGEVNISSEIKYNYSPYIKSKEALFNLYREKKQRGEWNNVVMLHPVNFNSIGRKRGFLFHKIFQSIIKKDVINIGDINIDRDMIHAKYLVEKSISASNDEIVGSGFVTNVEEFVSNLYLKFDMRYKDFVIKDKSFNSPHKNNTFWAKNDIKYLNLLKETANDIESAISQRHSG